MKINSAQSEAHFKSLSTIRRSNTEALQYKRQIECNRITNDNQKINKMNEKHVKNHRSSRTPQDGRSLRSSIATSGKPSTWFPPGWRAGGKPSTWFPPGRLVEQSGVKEEGIHRKTNRRKQSEKATRRGSRNRQDMPN